MLSQTGPPLAQNQPSSEWKSKSLQWPVRPCVTSPVAPSPLPGQGAHTSLPSVPVSALRQTLALPFLYLELGSLARRETSLIASFILYCSPSIPNPLYFINSSCILYVYIAPVFYTYI